MCFQLEKSHPFHFHLCIGPIQSRNIRWQTCWRWPVKNEKLNWKSKKQRSNKKSFHNNNDDFRNQTVSFWVYHCKFNASLLVNTQYRNCIIYIIYIFILYCSDMSIKVAPVTPAIPTKEDILNSPSKVPHVECSESENALATFFDVAVLRCLFISHWPEEGVYWALTFFHKR